MKIVMLVLNNFTHDARVHKEAKTLAAAGHDVTVIALWKNGLPVTEHISGYHLQRLQLHSRTWRGNLLAPLIKYIEFAYRVMQSIQLYSVDIVHANDANTLPAAYLAAKRSKALLIYDAHELETGRNFGNSTLSKIYQQLWAFPERLFIHKVNAVITVCDSIAEELVKLYNIDRPTVVINCPETVDITRSNRLRVELGIPEDLHILVYQGGIMSGRGIEAFLQASQKIPSVAAVLLGDGPLLEELHKKAQQGILQRVYLPGKVPLTDLPSYTASADIGISIIEPTCRSYYYALPNKLFEYMQARIPVIGSNLPEIAHIIRTYDVGEVVNPDDPDAIAAGIKRLIEDKTRYQKVKANTRNVAELYNWQHESEKLLALYQRLKS